MSALLTSGNLFGFLGMILALAAGIQLMRRSHVSGVLFVVGAAMLLVTRLFALYIAPGLIKPMHNDFNHLQITMMKTVPHFVFLLGFFCVFLGFVFLKLKESRQLALAKIRK